MNYLKYSLSELKYFNIQCRICLKHRSTTAHTLLKYIKFLPLSCALGTNSSAGYLRSSTTQLLLMDRCAHQSSPSQSGLSPSKTVASCIHFILVVFHLSGVSCVFNYFNFFKFIFLVQFGVTDDHRKVLPHWPSGNATDHAHCSSLRAHLLVGSSILTYCPFNSYQIWP